MLLKGWKDTSFIGILLKGGYFLHWDVTQGRILPFSLHSLTKYDCRNICIKSKFFTFSIFRSIQKTNSFTITRVHMICICNILMLEWRLHFF
jgi:hypothetical protein